MGGGWIGLSICTRILPTMAPTNPLNPTSLPPSPLPSLPSVPPLNQRPIGVLWCCVVCLVRLGARCVGVVCRACSWSAVLGCVRCVLQDACFVRCSFG